MAMWLLVYGDLAHGIRDIVGPFRSEAAAETWHETSSPWRSVASDCNCAMVPLTLPEEAVVSAK